MKYYKDRVGDIWLERDGKYTIIFSPEDNVWLGDDLVGYKKEYWKLKEITEEEAFLETI